MFWGKGSLFRKFFMPLACGILACFFILGVSFLLLVSKNHIEERLDALGKNADTVALTTARLIESGFMETQGEESIVVICNTLAQLSTAIDADIFICDSSGEVILCKELLQDSMSVTENGRCIIHENYHIEKSQIEEAINSKEGYYKLTKLDGIYKDSHLVVGESIVANGNLIGVVFATRPTSEILKPYFFSVLKIFLLAGAISLLLLFICVYLVVYRLTNPLSRMVSATKSYASGDFSVRIAPTKDDELGELVTSFNAMAQSLSILETSRRSFVANVSHELKTPMTTIGGFIDGILDGTIPPEKHKYYLKIVSSEVKRLSRLVVAMLNLSKIETGQVNLKLSNFSITKQLVSTILTFEKSIDEKHIEITGLDTLEDVFLDADEDMINQVVYNLIENAVKFTPEEGRIDFKIEEIDSCVKVTIGNTGDGIESEQLSRIFERFYKVDTSRSFDVKGAGLGLYLVKTLVELHNGKVEVKSKVGEYTEFSFSIPNRRNRYGRKQDE